MNKIERREKTTYFVKVLMTVIASIAGVACFLEEKLMLGGLYIGMACLFLISMIVNLFRFAPKSKVEKDAKKVIE